MVLDFPFCKICGVHLLWRLGKWESNIKQLHLLAVAIAFGIYSYKLDSQLVLFLVGLLLGWVRVGGVGGRLLVCLFVFLCVFGWLACGAWTGVAGCLFCLLVC